ncbi:sugar phosphate nucleotidyltransferase [Niallia circulans]|uniref:sugar phosphate nucleotidyltransferase n=1 Tax=Niallia circulans TaxID=1397 RepID=UPI0035260F3E
MATRTEIVKYKIQKCKADVTMCCRTYEYKIPFGVIQRKEINVKRILEKPKQNLFVSSGINLFQVTMLDYLLENQHLDMLEFLNLIIDKEKNIHISQMDEYWADVGTIEQLEKARLDKEINNQ